MQKIILQFPNPQILWSFAKVLKVQDYKIDSDKLLLICHCSEELISEALTFYKAKIIQDHINAE